MGKITITFLLMMFFFMNLKLSESKKLIRKENNKDLTKMFERSSKSCKSKGKGKGVNNCIEHNECPKGFACMLRGYGKANAKSQKKCYKCECMEPDQCYFYNRSLFCNCSGTGFTGDFCETKTFAEECGEIPLVSSIKVNNESGNYSVGSRLPYNCNECTSFTPEGSPDYIECGIDGFWILPEVLCVNGGDVGYLKDGSIIPNNAKGCLSEFNTTCSSLGLVDFGYRDDGTSGDYCYCDGRCCNHGDCCYDMMCL